MNILKQKFAKIIMLLGFVLLGNTVLFGQNDINSDVRRLLTRARTAYEMGEYADALREYQAVSKLVPDFPDIHKAIGDAYEQMGGEENLQKAIDSYTHYLSLLPDAEDKLSIQDKIAKLEYVFEKTAEQNFILEDLNGIWISNLVNISDRRKREAYFSLYAKEQRLSQQETAQLKARGMVLDTCYRVDMNLTPLLLFRITEMGRTGRYRVEILKESAFYKESIIRKIVNIVPDKKNAVRFTFADEAKYIPSQAKWDWLRIAGSVAGGAIGGIGGQLTELTTSAAADFGRESDIPSNTQTVYDFELQYRDGELVGYCQVIQGYSSAKEAKDMQNDFYEIKFWKENEYFDKMKLLQGKERRSQQERQAERKAKKPLFGFSAGLSFPTYNIDGYINGNENIEIDKLSEMRIGLFLEFRLADFLSIQPGIYANIQSGHHDYLPFFDFQINLLGKYKFRKSTWYAGLGPVVHLMNDEREYRYRSEYYTDWGGNYYDDGTIRLKSTDFSLNLKLGYSIRAFFIEFGHNAGMRNISAEPYLYIKRSSTYGSIGLKF